MSEYHAFSERIGREVALQPLTAEDINDLVKSYLDRAREDTTDAVDPFTDEGLDLILRQSQGNIRQVLSLCSQSLDEAVEKNIPKIESKVIQTVID
jgi:type II secretory pathway predicted ATPase ExeA